MSKDPFLVLGISQDATQVEAEAAYNNLREKYRLDMHQEGARGKAAAEALTDLDEAYRQVLDIMEQRVSFDGSVFGQIEQYIKENRYEEAQGLLDNVSERNAEWHYLQSALYYKKGWLAESRSQLKMACSMEPSNQKYKNALNKLENKTGGGAPHSNTATDNGNGAQYQQQNNGYNRSYTEYENRRRSDDTACAFCQGLICADLCCDCMRCM